MSIYNPEDDDRLEEDLPQHTPAPWIPTLNPSNDHEAEVLTRGVRRLCVARCGHGDEAEANARLIAAAPELLAALQECITDEGATCFARRDTHPEYMDRRINYISDIARAAIAKATQP
jgi:hypothetical protein